MTYDFFISNWGHKLLLVKSDIKNMAQCYKVFMLPLCFLVSTSLPEIFFCKYLAALKKLTLYSYMEKIEN